MAGKKRGTPGEKTPGTMQLFSWGCRVERLKAMILEYAEKHGVTPEVATNRMLERWAVQRADKPAGYARGVDRVDVHVLDEWPKHD